jgi:hypothetical protein
MNIAPPCLRINGRRVFVEYVCPATTLRDFDYCASFEGNDIGDPQGYGPTAVEAFEDLAAKIEDTNPPEFESPQTVHLYPE